MSHVQIMKLPGGNYDRNKPLHEIVRPISELHPFETKLLSLPSDLVKTVDALLAVCPGHVLTEDGLNISCIVFPMDANRPPQVVTMPLHPLRSTNPVLCARKEELETLGKSIFGSSYDSRNKLPVSIASFADKRVLCLIPEGHPKERALLSCLRVQSLPTKETGRSESQRVKWYFRIELFGENRVTHVCFPTFRLWFLGHTCPDILKLSSVFYRKGRPPVAAIDSKDGAEPTSPLHGEVWAYIEKEHEDMKRHKTTTPKLSEKFERKATVYVSGGYPGCGDPCEKKDIVYVENGERAQIIKTLQSNKNAAPLNIVFVADQMSGDGLDYTIAGKPRILKKFQGPEHDDVVTITVDTALRDRIRAIYVFSFQFDGNKALVVVPVWLEKLLRFACGGLCFESRLRRVENGTMSSFDLAPDVFEILTLPELGITDNKTTVPEPLKKRAAPPSILAEKMVDTVEPKPKKKCSAKKMSTTHRHGQRRPADRISLRIDRRAVKKSTKYKDVTSDTCPDKRDPCVPQQTPKNEAKDDTTNCSSLLLGEDYVWKVTADVRAKDGARMNHLVNNFIKSVHMSRLDHDALRIRIEAQSGEKTIQNISVDRLREYAARRQQLDALQKTIV